MSPNLRGGIGAASVGHEAFLDAGRKFLVDEVQSVQEVSHKIFMKILFLSHYYPPEGNAPATRVGALARRWVKAGHEVTVVTGAPNVPEGVVYPGFKTESCRRNRRSTGYG